MTTLLEQPKRTFTPGTTGWSADDLLDTTIEKQWEAGAYEIVEGVLTIMPPAQFFAGSALFNLAFVVRRFMEKRELKGQFALETDYIVAKHRVARGDAVLVMEADFPLHRRTSQYSRRFKKRGKIGRLTRPPLLVVELISPGHEHHDRVIKYRWYEEAKVPHYWILDEKKRTLECFRHNGEKYLLDARGKGTEIVRPSLFEGLAIPLRELWI